MDFSCALCILLSIRSSSTACPAVRVFAHVSRVVPVPLVLRRLESEQQFFHPGGSRFNPQSRTTTLHVR